MWSAYLAIRMSADKNVTDVIDYTAKFQSTRLCGDGVKAERVFVWNKIASIAYNEHVANI